MPSRQPQRPSSSGESNARARIAAKRAARRRPLPVPPITIIVGVVGVIAVVLLIGLVVRVRATFGVMQEEDPRVRQQAATAIAQTGDTSGVTAGGSLDLPFNVLLIGVDKRPNPEEGVRSDTLIVVHVDPQQKSASMLSIPRDTIVDVPNFGQAKINTAYTNGYNNAAEVYGANTTPDAAGGALAAETVEQFLGVPVDYVAQVDFNGFAGLVDAVGGVAVDVERPLLDAEFPTDDYGVERVLIPAGLQIMDGRTALVYARSRHASDDFGRGQRQQQVLRALIAQVRGRGLLENAGAIGEWVDVLSANVRTTLPIQDPATIAQLLPLARDISAGQLTQLSINPNDVQVTMNGSDLYWNQADLEVLVARWQAGPGVAGQVTTNATNPATRIQVVNAAGVEGLATQMTTALRAKGWTLVDPVTAPQIESTTQIVSPNGDSEPANQLASQLGLSAQAITSSTLYTSPDADLLLVVGTDYQASWFE